MDSPRIRSENRAMRGYGFPKESIKSPDGFRGKRNPGREGLGRATPQIDWSAYIAEHFAAEHYGYVLMHAQALYCRQPKRDRQLPTPADVLARMQSFGHTARQMQAQAEEAAA